MNLEYEKCLERSIKFLERSQLKDGSFSDWSSSREHDFKNAKRYNSIFPSCLILACLNGTEAENIKSKIAWFLLSQKSDFWSFNYWKRKSPESKRMPYPDDLDDTFCALSALYQFDPSLVGGEALAKIITLLTLVEEKEGGPYRTWVVSSDSDKAWTDIDLAVNSNVGFFLHLNDVDLPNIELLAEEKIRKKNFFSPYYPSEFPVIYFISRFYKGSEKRKLVEFLISCRKKQNHWGSPLKTALAVSSLLNFNYPPEELESSIDYLAKNQIGGKWRAEAFCIDPAINRKTYYAGSAALTTAFCLEAIQKYEKKSAKPAEKESKDKNAQKFKRMIIEKTKERFNFFGSDFRDKLDRILSKIIKKDSTDQITLLPYFFRNSLGENAKKISDEMVIRLGSANLFGWIAYTIYDDFLDEEGKSQMLPLANVCLRELSEIFFEASSGIKGFDSLFKELMDKLERANFWEVLNCRIKMEKGEILIPQKFPDYSNLLPIADRSMGHILGVLAIAQKSGSSPGEIKKLISCFRCYIVSKQLNDDAHDWEEDLKKGNLSPVVCEILKKFKMKYRRNSIDFLRDKEKLQKIFWLDIIDKVSGNIIRSSLESQEIIKTIKIIEKPDFFLDLFRLAENSARKTLEEKREVAVFLKNI